MLRAVSSMTDLSTGYNHTHERCVIRRRADDVVRGNLFKLIILVCRCARSSSLGRRCQFGQRQSKIVTMDNTSQSIARANAATVRQILAIYQAEIEVSEQKPAEACVQMFQDDRYSFLIAG